MALGGKYRPGHGLTARAWVYDSGRFAAADRLKRESAYSWPGGIAEKPTTLAQPRHREPQQGSVQYGDLTEQLLQLEDLGIIHVILEGEQVPVLVDPEKGPRWGKVENDWLKLTSLGGFLGKHSTWMKLSRDEKEHALVMFAKRLKFWRERGEAFATTLAEADPEDIEVEKSPEEREADERQRIQLRCQKEMVRPTPAWTQITNDTVTSGHFKRAPGMIYNIEFPWTEAMLIDMGPAWLTNAFHTAGTLELDNSVTKIIPESKIKVTTGNNGGKFLFEVKYAKKRSWLHTKLFAKVPFPLEGVTKSDRLSSSVNKQPQELYEINSSRLLEGTLPVKIPKFYFGDISNETSNWILITAAIPFADPVPLNFGVPSRRRKPLDPFVVEGPYDKCIDHTLRGRPEDYYMLLVVTGAKIAGLHKAGKMGSQELLSRNFADLSGKTPGFFGLSGVNASGEDPRIVTKKLDTGVSFVSTTGNVLFPEYATEEWCDDVLKDTMLTVNCYTGELQYWKHSLPDYIALSHCNLNVDNAYFWRDEDGKLDVGVLDWGNMGIMSLGHRLWWWLYCSDYEHFRDFIKQYVAAFIDTYAEYGGPTLDKDILYNMIIVTSMEQLLTLMYAVPQVYKMCGKGEWETIQDRWDPRIAKNIDSKSTLRLYLHVMNSVIRIMEEMEGVAVLWKFIKDVFTGEWKVPPKSHDVIYGMAKTGFGL